MVTGTARRLNSFTELPAGPGVHGRPRLGSADEEALRGHRATGRQHRPRRRGGDRAAAGEHRPQLPASRRRSRRGGSDADVARRATAGRSRSQKIAGSKVRFNSNTGFKSPGLDINDVGFMRRADMRSMSNWIQFRNDTPSKYLRSFRCNLNQWGDLELRRRPARSRRQRQRALGRSRTTGAPGWASTRNARPFDDRATRGDGPGRVRQPELELLGLRQFRRAQARRRLHLLQPRRRRPRQPAGSGVSPGVTFRPTSFLSLSTGVDWNHNVQDAQWVENTADGRYVFGRLDQTTVSLTMRVNYTITPQLSVQIYAAPFVSAGDYDRLQAAGRTAAPRATRIATRRSPTRAIPTSTTGRSAPPTSCAGSTSPARRCSSSGSRGAKTCSTRAASVRPRLRRHVRRAVAERVPREVELLDQPVAGCGCVSLHAPTAHHKGHEAHKDHEDYLVVLRDLRGLCDLRAEPSARVVYSTA